VWGTPALLSAGFILEEGLSMDTLRTVVTSMQEAAAQAKVQLVTGDTKVVDKECEAFGRRADRQQQKDRYRRRNQVDRCRRYSVDART
jgi:thiamine monophosphate kinase